ncbi:potassium-transporting ATPase subunit KdpC [Streptomyces thermodiastaticus]|uniref:potassium-transporting ATPase subunit KdpC n=1 Tax=Streptomyces thermodiastaticus TaxID=44061 RepID=UPI0016727D71|nr:potassium-transporting ATPase subunit KdpC [Streptomyces thermodiastaticus]MCE7551719.1 potassium-transporting ATPase subunit KdpC [Streptomyces thermodiastaticus]GHF76835.1 potassium-transporting ATPase KdpC subunit [Streptomyces thermodiastaticus]
MDNSSWTNLGRTMWAALRMLLVLTVVAGVVYPLAVTGIGQAAFHDKADGSLMTADGREVGSKLIGQSWNLPGTDRPDPKWFQGRPSHSDCDPLATGSSQLGASDPTLVKSVKEAKEQVAAFNNVPESEVPADAVTGSASAIDPDISPQYADIQVRRVAEADGLPVAQVRKLVAEHTEGRTLGFMGEPHVNVLQLNLALKDLVSKQ